MHTHPKDNLIYFPLILISLFPYFTFYSFGSDIQPWAIILVVTLSTILLLIKNTINIEIFLLWVPLLFSIILLSYTTDLNSGLRSVAGYFTIGLVPFVFLYILKNKFTLFEFTLKISTFIYFFVGLAQTFFSKTFMSGYLNRLSTTDDRGVTSLTAEPTFYGLVCLFLILIFYTLDIKNKNPYIYLLLIQIVFLAQSSMVIMFLIIYSFFYIIFKSTFKTFFLLILLSSLTIFLMLQVDIANENIRFFSIIEKFVEDPSYILMADSSINFRVAGVYLPLKGFIDNYLLPNGYDTYLSYQNMEVLSGSLFQFECSGCLSLNNRISSYYGTAIYELGIIGLIIPAVYSFLIYNAYKKNFKDFFIHFLFVNMILFTAIPISFTLVGIYFSTLIYKAKYVQESSKRHDLYLMN